MSEIICVDFGPVKNGKVYDFWESITASKYPMAADVERVKKVYALDGIKGTTNAIAMAPIGSGHDQFLTGLRVAFDLTLSVEAWNCIQRYHFFDFVSSQSKMHRALKFDLDRLENFDPHVDKRIIDILKEKRAEYEALPEREKTVERELDFTMSLPIGFRLTARMTTNYRQLKTIYSQRSVHKLPELRAFCAWMRTLPMPEWITGNDTHEELIELDKYVFYCHRELLPGSLYFDKNEFPEAMKWKWDDKEKFENGLVSMRQEFMKTNVPEEYRDSWGDEDGCPTIL